MAEHDLEKRVAELEKRLAAGLVSIGGLSLGLVVALGGFAIGGLAIGGAAIGGAAAGGGAAGYYACGATAAGVHATSAEQRDPAAEAFFRQYGLAGLCDPGRRFRP